MRKELKAAAAFAALITAASLAVSGCGGSPAGNASANFEAEEAAYDYEEAYEGDAVEEEAGTADFDYYAEPAMEDAEVSEKSSNTAGSGEEQVTESSESTIPAAEGGESTAAVSDTEAARKKAEEKLVYTCSLTMQTLTYEETVRNIREKIREAGGIIEAEDETNSDSYWYESGHRKTQGKMRLFITVRIPTAKYESFLHSLEGDGKIMNKNSSVENISRRYRDTQAIIRNLEIQEERLQAMMDKAETIEEMIAVEDRLTEVQTELDQRRTQLASMDTDVALSTVNLTIEEVVQYTPEPEKEDTFADRLKKTVKGSARNFRELLETLLFAAIYLAPVALVVLVVFFIIRALHRAYRARHPKAPKPPKTPKPAKGSRGLLLGKAKQDPPPQPEESDPSGK